MPKRILCLETDWGINNSSRRLVDSATVKPLFDFISNCSYLNFKVTYKTVSTVEELRFLLSQMRKNQNNDFDIVYFAFHGDKGKIQLFEKKDINTYSKWVSLEELSEMAEGCLSGKKVMFGSCSTLSAAESRIDSFMEQTGAIMVSGYKKIVDYVKSSILDLALISEIAVSRKQSPDYIRQQLEKRYSGLMEELKMVIY